MADCSNTESLTMAVKWYNVLIETCPNPPPTILAFNKCDLVENPDLESYVKAI